MSPAVHVLLVSSTCVAQTTVSPTVVVNELDVIEAPDAAVAPAVTSSVPLWENAGALAKSAMMNKRFMLVDDVNH
jgi:hypothetical protein